MELRIFFQPARIPLDLTQSLIPRLRKSPPEVRTDLYLNLKDAAIGLKYRSGRKIELKIRSSRSEHGCEKWHKSISEKLEADSKQHLISVIRQYEKTVQQELSDLVARCATLLEPIKRSQITYELKKERFQSFVDLSELGGPKGKRVVIEQTEVTLAQEQSMSVWRSICVEGHSDVESLALAIDLIKKEMLKLGSTEEDILNHVWTVGYPEFISRLSEST